MAIWYSKVLSDLGLLGDMIAYYDGEILEAKKECKLRGRIEQHAADMPSQLEHRFNQLQDIEAVLEHLNIELRKIHSQVFHDLFYNIKSARALTARECEKFADGDPKVYTMQEVVNQVALLRNEYLGILKAFENKQWQITNIVKLRAAGLDDAEV
jgi:hypothetical protein